jgi:hypothetical protein
MGKGLDRTAGVRDAVVKDHDGAGRQVLLDEPLDVPNRRMRRVVGVGGPENWRVAKISRSLELPGPRESGRWSEELGRSLDPDRRLRLEQLSRNVSTRSARQVPLCR